MGRPTFGESLEGETPELGPDLDQSSTTLETKRYNPRADLHFNETQRIANKLPEWNKIRKRRQSNGQVLLNELYGRPLDDGANMLEQSFRSRFLSLIPLDEPDIVHEVSIPDSLDLSEPTGVSNFVKNSYFQIWSYTHQIPDYWQYNIEAIKPQLITSTPVGHNAVRITGKNTGEYPADNGFTLSLTAGTNFFTVGATYKYKLCLYDPARDVETRLSDEKSIVITDSSKYLSISFSAGSLYREAVSLSGTLSSWYVRVYRTGPNGSVFFKNYDITSNGISSQLLDGKTNETLVLSNNFGSVFQDLNLFLRANEEWTLSCFYRVPSGGGTNVYPGEGYLYYGLKLIGTPSDGTSDIEKVINFSPTTIDNWHRAVLSTSFSKEIRKVRVEVNSDYFRSVDISCFQLEPGSKASSWRPREDDKYPFMNRTTRAPLFIGGGSDSATYVDDSDDFWYDSIPNRATFIQKESASVTSATSAGRLPLTDFSGDNFFFTYRVQGGKLRFHDNKHTEDILRDFYLAFRDHDGFYKIKDGFTLETLTYFNKKLWVLGKVADFTGSTVRVLYVVDPNFPWPAPTYLQVIGGCKIPTDVSLHTTMIRMEFRNEDRQHLYIYDSNYLYVVQLRYDIYTLSRDRRKVLLREKYGSVTVF